MVTIILGYKQKMESYDEAMGHAESFSISELEMEHKLIKESKDCIGITFQKM